jgi:hypothetical protein
MLPDFPVQKQYMASQISKAIAQRMKKDPLVSMIHAHYMKEGSSVEVQSPGWRDQVELTEVGFEGQVSLDDLIKEGPEAYLKQALRAAEAFIEAQHKMLIAKVNEVTEKTGMTLDAKGKPFSPEMLLEAMERMELSFSETGQPIMPTLVVHPKLLETIKEKMPEWEKDESFMKRRDELIDRKRREWLDRENRRKLVD